VAIVLHVLLQFMAFDHTFVTFKLYSPLVSVHVASDEVVGCRLCVDGFWLQFATFQYLVGSD